MRTHTRPTLALVIGLAMVLSACSGSEDSSGPETVDDAIVQTISDGASIEPDVDRPGDSAEEVAPVGSPVAPESDPLGTGGVEPVSLTPADLGRDIVFTAQITTAVTDVVGAGEEATRIIQSIGGFVFGQRTTGDPQSTSTLTFKVQPDDFQTALDRLGSIGQLRDQTVSADDVTGRVIDLRSQIITAETSVERLRGFLENATDIDTIADLERQLLERETTLERLRGQLRTLEDQVSLATIVLTIVEAGSRHELQVSVTAYPGHDGGGAACPGDSVIRVEEGEAATLCFEIFNTGDTDLTDIAVNDTILGVDTTDLTVVFGDPEAVLEPGDSILLAHEIEPERDLRTRTTVTGTALDEDGAPIPTRNATVTTSFLVDTVQPDGVPGFAAGLEASLDLLRTIAQVAILALGVALPFVWVIPLVWWVRRRTAGSVGQPKAPRPGTRDEHTEDEPVPTA